MYYEDFFTNVVMPISLVLVIGVFLANLDNKQSQKVELIKNTKEYEIYDECYSLDDKYYCYNLEEAKD